MGTQPGNNGTLSFYGGTEMTSDELRDRIAEIVNAALVAWNTDMDTQDSEGEYAAQAIIDEFGLTMHGDDCDYHEIYGSYDTRFGK